MRKPAKVMVLGSLCGLVFVYACSGGSTHPPAPTDVNKDGSSLVPFDGTTFPDSSGSVDASQVVDATDSGLSLSCFDTIEDKDETDVDCGGSCTPCIDGKVCVQNKDCAGSFCDPATKKCKTATCNDNVKNGKETGTDCGGGTCQKCAVGGGCAVDTDCLAGKCDSTKVCGCPDRMIGVGNGGPNPYCIDQTEVPSGEYDKFLKANQLITQQVAQCLPPVNPSYIPGGAWPPPQPLSSSDPYPVRYVDWCDANAYCRWAGKQLCGKVRGGSLDVTTDAGATDPQVDAWYNACSGGGANKFPYGNVFNGNTCNGAGFSTDGGAFSGPLGVATYDDTGNYTGIPLSPPDFRSCQGTETNLYGMSGNVAEWEDSCSAGGDCLVRGGSFDSANSASLLACTGAELLPRTTHREDVGFRCCQF
jgi:formylglycine-generating enzyme required for sulfatase activity